MNIHTVTVSKTDPMHTKKNMLKEETNPKNMNTKHKCKKENNLKKTN